MVWHSYMLNPRAYLEDCIREGRMTLWNSYFPWAAVAAVIDARTFEYDAPESAQALFTQLTGSTWLNESDVDSKIVACPRCNEDVQVPWTTCGSTAFRPPVGSGPVGTIKRWAEAGNGYADKELAASCDSCRMYPITHDNLIATKFIKDCEQLQRSNIAMRGTMLTYEGIPISVATPDRIYQENYCTPHMKFVNLLMRHLASHLTSPPARSDLTSLKAIVDDVEAHLKDRAYMKAFWRATMQSRPHRDQGIHLRKIFSRYWNNPSPFALDLVGAVIRQGSFITKMHDIDWLHSPGLHNTMDRSIVKYYRFMAVMSANKKQMCVPTLEIDLAWHTHQLSPYSYLIQSLLSTERFIDHDDKVTEVSLSASFANTAKRYQDIYGEPYAECTCWFCEAVRESNAVHLGVFSSGVLDDSALADLDRRTTPHDPRSHAHISAHNACAPDDSALYRAKAAVAKRKLVVNAAKAEKRAAKKRRGPSPSSKIPAPSSIITSSAMIDEHLSYVSSAYGRPVRLCSYLPFDGDPAKYRGWNKECYAFDPAWMALEKGTAGNCAAGTCGAIVAAGGCGAGQFVPVPGSCGGGGPGGGCVGGGASGSSSSGCGGSGCGSGGGCGGGG